MLYSHHTIRFGMNISDSIYKIFLFFLLLVFLGFNQTNVGINIYFLNDLKQLVLFVFRHIICVDRKPFIPQIDNHQVP